MLITDNPVLRVPAAPTADAVAFFSASLAHHTDVSDVHAALESGTPGFVLVDSRGLVGWEQGHIPGAVHVPTAEVSTAEIPAGTTVVTYCWGPACNGATRAALAFAQRGYPVKEMLGGIEYWIREGFPVDTATGRTTRTADPLTAPFEGISCDC